MYTNLSSNEGTPFRYAYHRPGAPPAYWARPGPTPERSDDANIAAVATVTGSLGLLGFARIGGRRVWDRYLSTIEKFETASPARVFRTFRYSEALSPLGSHQRFDISDDFLKSLRGRKFMAGQLGMGMAELEATGAFYHGLEFERTGKLFGQVRVKGTGEVLSHAAMPMKAGAGAEYINWWARVTGQKIPMSGNIYHSDIPEMIAVSGRPMKLDKVLGIPVNETAQRWLNKASTLATHQRAYWAGQVGRLNKLLQAPAELFSGVPGVKWLGEKLSVKPGTATSMLGRYVGKGMGIFAAFTGLSYLSYLRRESDNRLATTVAGTGIGAVAGGLFARSPMGMAIGAIAGGIFGGSPRFDQGIFQGFGSMYEDVTLAHARLSQAVGLTQAKMEQEQFMPGVTKPRTLAGLAGFGAVAGGMMGYAAKVSQFARFGTDETLSRLTSLEERAAGKLGWLVGKGTGASAVERLMMRGGRIGGLVGAGLFAGFAGIASIATGSLPGILGTSKSPEELRAIYSGEQLVPVRSGKYWEFGRQPWEGGRIKYYRPHLLALAKTHARDIGLYGSEEEKWAQHPLIHPWKALTDEEFKYRWERQHMYNRPYPMTGRAGADIPFVGPLFAATIGKLIKPPKLIRPEEWLTEQGGTLQIPTGGSNEPVGGQGIGPGSPISPLEGKQVTGEMIYRLNELRGLTGFLHGAIKEHLTGSQDYYDQVARLETAERATGSERAYWEQQLGGLGGLTEAFRRFLPHRRRQIELYNPLRNQMPSWMPGANYFRDFQRGDPYCLSSDSLVETGLLQFGTADSINRNTKLISAQGLTTEVTATAIRKSEPLVSVTLATLPAFPIKCTIDHPFLTRKLVKGRNRKARVKIFKYANKLLQNIRPGLKRIDISNKAGVKPSVATAAWKILEKYNKIIIDRNGQRGSVTVINSELFNEDLLDRGLLFIEAQNLSEGDYVAYPKPKRSADLNKLDIADLGPWTAITDKYIYYRGKQEYAENFEYLTGDRKDPGNKSDLHIARALLRNNGTPGRYRRFIDLDYNFGRFVGLWCAEGWASNSGGCSMAHHSKEKEYIDRVYKAIEQEYTWHEDGNCAYTTFGSKALAYVLDHLCGKGAPNKKLSDIFMRAPEDFCHGFIDGLFFGDGCEFESDNRLVKSLKTSSYMLAIQVRKLLLSLGQMSSVSCCPPNENNELVQNSGPSWIVKIHGNGSDSYGCQWFADDEYYYLRVSNIKDAEAEETYGFSTDSHTFCAIGVATHNTKVDYGDIRLPGKGYAALNPEVAGLAPSEYPLFHRFKILCLDANTELPTDQDIKKIKDITLGDKVIGQDGKYHNVIAIQNKQVYEEAYIIETFYNEEPLMCSKKHKVLTATKNGKIVEKRAKDINTDDYLLFPRSSFGYIDNICIGDFCDVSDVACLYKHKEYWAHVKGAQNYIRFNLRADYNLGFVFGLYIAEGCTGNSNRCTWTFHLNEKDTLGAYIRDFASYIGLTYHDRAIEKQHTYQISICNKLLARFMKKCFGTGSNKKKIGINILDYNKDFVRGIIDGYMNGDGYLVENKNLVALRATSTSSVLLKQIKIILAALGVISSFRERKGNSWTDRPQWYLDIQRQDINKIYMVKQHHLDKCKYNISTSKRYGYRMKDFIAVRIKNISINKRQCDWYDITLDGINDVHSFSTVSGIVHNSDVAMWSDEFKKTKRQMQSALKRGELTQDQIAAFERINHQVSQKKKRRRFQQYQYTEDALKKMNVKVTEEVGPGLYRTERHGMISLAGIDMSELAGDEIAASNASKQEQRGTRRKQAIVSDYLREHIYPGAELDVYVHRDLLHRYKRGKEGYYQPAVIEANGLNIGRSLIKKGMAEPTTDMFGTYSKYGMVKRTLGRAWESVAHMDSPLEYLTPASPLSKFVRQRTATEEYERVRAYGTESAFWQHPYENFIRPTGTMMARVLGSDELPDTVKKRNAIEEYFDKLKWVKYKSLEKAAMSSGTAEDVKEMRAQQRRTLIGVNPYGSRSYIYSAIPSLDRDYYEDFAESADPAERAKILKMLPKNQHSLYIARWAGKLATALRAKRDMGDLSGEEEQQLKNLGALRYSEGRPVNQQLTAQYREEAPEGMSYAEWSRWKETEDYFSKHPLPRFNSPVWSPAYNLEDLKLNMVQNEGMDIHDFNLWQSQAQQLTRKPYIENPEAFNQQDHASIARAVENTLRNNLNMNKVRVRTVQTMGPGGIDLQIDDTRKNVIDKYKNDPDFQEML